MTPDERQLLTGLFDRMTGAAMQPRDREAEALIGDRVRGQPYAPYLLSQTVIVQEQALRAAAAKIQALEAQLQGGQPQEETSFLGHLGKSIFGSGPAAPQRQPGPPAGGAWGQGQGYAQPQPPQGGPWGGGGQGSSGYAPQSPQGGGFLRGALGAAAGVAGGVLAADALRGLFGGHNNPFGIASGGFGGGFGAPGGETIVNNYYGDEAGAGGQDGFSQADVDASAQQDFLQDQSDDFSGGGDVGGDDSFNV